MMCPTPFTNKLRLLAACLLALASPAWAGSTGAAGVPAYQPPAPPYATNDAERYEFHVMAGEMAIQRGDRQMAARQYADAVQFSKDPALAERATRIAVYAEQPESAYRASQVWSDGALQSVEAQRAATRLAFVAGDAKALPEYARRLVAASPSPDIGYRMLAEVLTGEPSKADLAIDTLTTLAASDAKSAPAQYALGTVALAYNRLAVAEKASAAAQALDSNWTDAALLRAGVLIRQDKISAAEQQIAALPGTTKKRARYHASLARLLLQAGNNSAGREEFRKAVAIDSSYSDARFGWALVSLGLGDLDIARAQFQHLYDQQDRADDAAFYLAAVADQSKRYADAQRWYQRVQNGNHAFEAQLRAAQMIYRQGNLSGARERLAELRQSYPDRVDALRAAESELLLDAGDWQAALDLMNTGLKDNPTDMDMLYGRSLVYERMGRIDDAEQDLQQMLAHDADDPRALNALGYMLTNHGSDYARARQLIVRALRADPDNPAVLDSLGWVQYKLGQLDSARQNLEKAFTSQPDAEVAAHLGEVRWAQGDKEAARRIWQDAHAKTPDNATLNETIKRLDS